MKNAQEGLLLTLGHEAGDDKLATLPAQAKISNYLEFHSAMKTCNNDYIMKLVCMLQSLKIFHEF